MFKDLSTQFDVEAFPMLAERLGEVDRAAEALRGVSRLRFFDAAETMAQRNEIREANSDFLDHILFVAADAGGVLYGIWLRGQPCGMWSMLDHHEIDISPAWRNVDDFIAKASTAELTPTLPDFADQASADEHTRWAGVREAYQKNFRITYDEDPQSMYALFFAYSIIALTPRAEAGSLIPFLSVENQWIAERAVVALGGFRHREAIPALVELSKGTGNGALAARGALRQMGHIE